MWAGLGWGVLGTVGVLLSPCLVGLPLLAYAGARIVAWAGGRGGWPGTRFVLFAFGDVVVEGVVAAGAATALGAPPAVVAGAAAVVPIALARLSWLGGAAPYPRPPSGAHRAKAALAWWLPAWAMGVALAMPSPALAVAAALGLVVGLPIGAVALAGGGGEARGVGRLDPLADAGVRLACAAAAAITVWALATPSPLRAGPGPSPEATRGLRLAVGADDGTAEIRDRRVVVRSEAGDLPGALSLPDQARPDLLALEPEPTDREPERGRMLWARADGRWYGTSLGAAGYRLDDGPTRRVTSALGRRGGLELATTLGLIAAWAAWRKRSARDSEGDGGS